MGIKSRRKVHLVPPSRIIEADSDLPRFWFSFRIWKSFLRSSVSNVQSQINLFYESTFGFLEPNVSCSSSSQFLHWSPPVRWATQWRPQVHSPGLFIKTLLISFEADILPEMVIVDRSSVCASFALFSHKDRTCPFSLKYDYLCSTWLHLPAMICWLMPAVEVRTPCCCLSPLPWTSFDLSSSYRTRLTFLRHRRRGSCRALYGRWTRSPPVLGCGWTIALLLLLLMFLLLTEGHKWNPCNVNVIVFVTLHSPNTYLVLYHRQ